MCGIPETNGFCDVLPSIVVRFQVELWVGLGGAQPHQEKAGHGHVVHGMQEVENGVKGCPKTASIIPGNEVLSSRIKGLQDAICNEVKRFTENGY